MYLDELLKMRGFDINSKTKIVRHKDKNFDVEQLYQDNMLDIYQKYQSKPVFSSCEYIVSFLGTEGTQSKYIGIYKVISQKKASEVKLDENYPYPESIKDDYFYYEMEKTDFLNDLIDRLVIDWNNPISWHQWLKGEKTEIIQILPKGYYKPFKGFEDFILSFNELELVINNPEANKEWHNILSSVSGIYLIVDSTDGSQYVGSAYGDEGIIGRWKHYVNSKHGGNILLQQLLAASPNRYKNFHFTILRTLPKSLTSKEIIQYESIYKEKLGTRAFGLNAN